MTTYTKDYFSPNDIKNILDRAVKNVEANINCYCLAPDVFKKNEFKYV